MKTIEWTGEALVLLDQTKLPKETFFFHCETPEEVEAAIRSLAVRGAPAIGVAGAYGAVLAAKCLAKKETTSYVKELKEALVTLGEARPTAVNLGWAIEEQLQVVDRVFQYYNANNVSQVMQHNDLVEAIIDALEERAEEIELEDISLCERIGDAGLTLFTEEKKYRILTHCNTGSLATAGIGTALGVIRKLHDQEKIEMVYADETRPLLQGARLTAYELVMSDIPGTLITDNMAAYVMQQGLVDAIIVGADRITTEGDVANKIGTYGLAVLAKHHGIPFYVAAPFSTFDFSMAKGKDIPIEMRAAEEVKTIQGVMTAPEEIAVLNPAFDVTPHELITGIITEEGVLSGDYQTEILALEQKVKDR